MSDLAISVIVLQLQQILKMSYLNFFWTFISYNLGDLRVNLRIMQKDFVFIYYSSMHNVIRLAVGKRRKTNASNFKRHFFNNSFCF